MSFFGYVVAMALSVSAIAHGLSVPDCQATAPNQTTIDVHNANLSLPGFPFGVVYASNNIAFAALTTGNNTGFISVLNTSVFAPSVIREIPIPFPKTNVTIVTGQLTITKDKRSVYVSLGYGAVVLDVSKAVAGDSDPFSGMLTGTAGDSAIQTTLSLDDKYAFVSQEYGFISNVGRGNIEVFKLDRACDGSVSGTYIGNITLDFEVVGSALSPDGKRLYAVSEAGEQAAEGTAVGTLSILDAEVLKTNPSAALLNQVSAGCSPVRVVVSSDGQQVWLTSRASNKLLAFDTRKLESQNASDALIAVTQVGKSPVGLTFVNHGRHIITADSDRFNFVNPVTGLTVVDVEAALKGKQGFPRIPTGMFPREFAVSPDGNNMLVSDYTSRAVQVVDLRQVSHEYRG